jgi:hypothetical protein
VDLPPDRAPKVPKMAHLSGYNILIVDFPGACDLREKLVRAGACVHVVTDVGAMILARTKKVDAAFISFDSPACADRLGDRLIHLGVGQIIRTAEAPSARMAAAPTSWLPLLGPTPARRMQPTGAYLH